MSSDGRAAWRRHPLAASCIGLLALSAALAGCGGSSHPQARGAEPEVPPSIAPPPPSKSAEALVRKREEAELAKLKAAARKQAEQEAAAAAGASKAESPQAGKHRRRGGRHAKGLARKQRIEAEKAAEKTARSKFEHEESAEIKAFKKQEREEAKHRH